MTDFLRPFLTLRSYVKVKPRTDITIDNIVFRQNYRTTSLILFISSILVTSRQYIGEHIKCVVGPSLNPRVVSSYCFFTGTFSVQNQLSEFLVENETIPHVGVGPYSEFSGVEIRRHLYYQWVPFFLFGQAIFFTLTHILWKKMEGGKLKAMLVGVENAAFSFAEEDVQGGGGQRIPSIEEKKRGVDLIKTYIVDSNFVGQLWAPSLILCEFLNILHVVLQFYITDQFLDGIFWDLGQKFWQNSDVLDIRFPKVSKCSFQKYGPSGTIQIHDVLCVMALNVIIEKIYTFLWFWFFFLFFLNLFNFLWRILGLLSHRKSPKFNRYIFQAEIKGKLKEMTELKIAENLDYKNWLFLKYLAKNCDGILFREILEEITDGFSRKVSQENPDEMYRLQQ